MQTSLNAFFKTTPEKNKTPEKSSPSSPSKTATPKSSPSPKKATPKNSSSKTTSSSPAKTTKSQTPEKSPKTTKTPKATNSPKTPSSPSKSSPEKEKVSRKRKVEEHDEENDDAKRLKEDATPPTTSKRSFSGDALLDDDSLDMPTTATPLSTTFQDDDSISDEALYNMEIPTTTTSSAKTATNSSSKSPPLSIPTSTSATTTTTSTTPTTPTPASTATKPAASKIASVSSAKPASIFQVSSGGLSDAVANIAKLLTEDSWKAVLQPEFKKPYFETLAKYLESEKAIKNNKIYPPEPLIFNAFNHASFDKVRVVILGQDPYINYNQAMGMSFSVPRGTTPPPSLKNIFKELSTDIQGFQVPNHGDLTRWADQGVLLLNAVLTVQASTSNSHKGKGWESFTAAAIKAINSKKENVVFLLWGKDAQMNASGVDNKKHLVLKAVHPSPFAADKGFFGCKHFSKANKYLEEHGLTPVDWSL